jgi:hypothetical protein
MPHDKHERTAQRAAVRLLHAVDRIAAATEEAVKAKDDFDRATSLRLKEEPNIGPSQNRKKGTQRGA